ncbi:hypothetical protein BV898_19944, partial [Hypsibius exemplaris]
MASFPISAKHYVNKLFKHGTSIPGRVARKALGAKSVPVSPRTMESPEHIFQSNATSGTIVTYS